MMGKSEKYQNIVIIFAGGNGSRMNCETGPKQFMEVKGKPVIIYTLEHFQNLTNIEAIYIACITQQIPHLKRLIKQFTISKVAAIVPGGTTAQASIYNGLKAAVDDSRNSHETIVLIHDGVRPIINNKLIRDSIDSVKEHDSAIASIPCFETIAQSKDHARFINCVTDRNVMYILQAPQSFRLGDVFAAEKKSEEEGLLGTFVDSAQLMKHYGYKLHMIEGFRGNVKITVPLDFAYFKFLVESGEFKHVTGENI